MWWGRPKRLAIALLCVMTLSACNSQPAPEPGAPEPSQGEQAPPPAPQPSSGDNTSPVPVVGSTLTFTPATDKVMRLSYPPGQTLNPAHEGAYFMNTPTGALEGWTIPDVTGKWAVAYSASPDGAWVIARTATDGYLIHRDSGEAYRWDRAQAELVAAKGAHLLFGAVTPINAGRDRLPGLEWDGDQRYTGDFMLLNDRFERVRSFHLSGAEGLQSLPGALLDPDRDRLAIAAGYLYIVEMSTGEVTQGDAVKGPVSLTLLNQPDQIAVNQRPGQWRTIALHNWDGKAVRQFSNPGTISPDGRHLVVEELYKDVLPLVTVIDAEKGTPLLRVKSAQTCMNWGGASQQRWMGDRFMVSTRDGPRYVTLSGEVAPVPGMDLPSFWHSPLPLTNGLIYDQGSSEQGHVIRVVQPDGQEQVRLVIGSAGTFFSPAAYVHYGIEGRDELFLFIQEAIGRGGPCGERIFLTEAQVEYPPFDETFRLVVAGTGDCLNLRRNPGLNWQVVTCLAGGTEVVAVPDKESYISYFVWAEGGTWLHVRTAGGAVGWVSVDAKALLWPK